jgi:hypothetical protein
VKAGRTITTAKGSISIELSVTNLTDRDNACCIDEIGLGTDHELGYWPGITPSLQLLFSF